MFYSTSGGPEQKYKFDYYKFDWFIYVNPTNLYLSFIFISPT